MTIEKYLKKLSEAEKLCSKKAKKVKKALSKILEDDGFVYKGFIYYPANMTLTLYVNSYVNSNLERKPCSSEEMIEAIKSVIVQRTNNYTGKIKYFNELLRFLEEDKK